MVAYFLGEDMIGVLPCGLVVSVFLNQQRRRTGREIVILSNNSCWMIIIIDLTKCFWELFFILSRLLKQIPESE